MKFKKINQDQMGNLKKNKKLEKKHIKTVFAVILFLSIYVGRASAYPNASSWEMVSPKNNEIIKSGELFINVNLLDSVVVLKGTFEFYIDDDLITNFVKFSENRISILYTLPLTEGKHILQLKIKSNSIGYLSPIVSTFYVNKFSGDRKDSVIVKKADFFELSGDIYGSDKEMNYSGTGAQNALAYPNVPHIRDLSADVVARVGQVSFPFKYFNTTDQNYYPGNMSRNYLQYGIRYHGLEFLYGDQTPMFDRLVMAGVRVKGWMFTYEGPKFKIQVVNGISQQKQEGALLSDTFRSPNHLPIAPSNLRSGADSLYVNPGLYQREISAARISFGNRIEGSVVSINLLRSRDDSGSIHYGPNASDNLVVGADESFITAGNKMRVNAGFALSAYTANIKGGPVTENQIDSLYGYKVGFNPVTFRNIFILNATTIKPDQPSTADYITAVFRSTSKDNATDNLLTIDYHYFGSSYVSFGNPLIQNDLWAGTLQDQFSFLNRKIILSAGATYQENNVAANELATLTTQIINGSAIIAPSQALPTLTFFVTDQTRNTPAGANTSNLVAANDAMLSYTGLLNYNLHLGDNITSFHVSYTADDRTDGIYTFNSNNITIIGGGITETLMKLNLSLDLHYSVMNYSNTDMANMQLSNTYSAHLRYEIRKIRTTISIGADITSSNEAELLGSSYSTRDLYNARISANLAKGLSLDVEAGIAPYTDLSYSSNSYQENYGLVRLMYNFDFRR